MDTLKLRRVAVCGGRALNEDRPVLQGCCGACYELHPGGKETAAAQHRSVAGLAQAECMPALNTQNGTNQHQLQRHKHN